jgi:hypothetical protein
MSGVGALNSVHRQRSNAIGQFASCSHAVFFSLEEIRDLSNQQPLLAAAHEVILILSSEQKPRLLLAVYEVMSAEIAAGDFSQ